MFERVRTAVDILKATARALDPICVDGGDAAALFELVSEGERVLRGDEGADGSTRR